MGRPALSITEAMMVDLPSILATTGATVEKRSIPSHQQVAEIAKDKRLPDFIYFCSSSDGAIVEVGIVCALNIAPDGIIAKFYPTSGKRRAAMTLLKQIELVLRERGAVDLAEQQGITEAMIPALPTILAATGAKVEQRPFQSNMMGAAGDSGLPETEFVCLSSKGAAVVVRFGRAAHVAPDGLAVVLHPASSPWWKRFGAIRLSKQIQAALREHGAIDLAKQKE